MSASPRTIVVMTGDGPEHRYVANRLCLAVPVAAVVVDTAVRPASIGRAFRGGVGRGASRVALHVFRKMVRDRAARAAAAKKVLGTSMTSQFIYEDRVARVSGVNSDDAVELLKGLQPDAIAIYGTTIVREHVLSQSRDIAFNMHTGISPYYRGTDCAFWPVVNREPERLGATVHECTSAVDAGPIFATGRADWASDDGLHELFARTVVKGADLYVEVLQKYLEGTIQGTEQDLAVGREYRGYMRTLGAELRARSALRRGLLRLVEEAPPRIRFFSNRSFRGR